MEKMIEKIEQEFFLFEKETDDRRKKRKAKKVVEIYDRIDRYLLSEEDDNFIYEMYSRVRNYLFDTVYWEEPELLPLF